MQKASLCAINATKSVFTFYQCKKASLCAINATKSVFAFYQCSKKASLRSINAEKDDFTFYQYRKKASYPLPYLLSFVSIYAQKVSDKTYCLRLANYFPMQISKLEKLFHSVLWYHILDHIYGSKCSLNSYKDCSEMGLVHLIRWRYSVCCNVIECSSFCLNIHSVISMRLVFHDLNYMLIFLSILTFY